jgi:hypothetical protein
MRIDRRVSPNQTVLWTLYELHNGAGQRHAAVQLACYYGRSTGVNNGHPGHSFSQVRALDHDRPPFFQAGHAGSIPVTRSTTIQSSQHVYVLECRRLGAQGEHARLPHERSGTSSNMLVRGAREAPRCPSPHRRGYRVACP